MGKILDIMESGNISELLSDKSLYGSVDDEGNTPLSLAFDHGISDEVIEQLLKVNDFDESNELGIRPVEKAIRRGRIKWVKRFIELGSDITRTERGSNFTPLMESVTANRVEVAKLLLQSGATLEPKDSYGFSAEDFARKMGRVEILKIFEEFKLKNS
jgi:ankyrin repeat protein